MHGQFFPIQQKGGTGQLDFVKGHRIYLAVGKSKIGQLSFVVQLEFYILCPSA